MKNPCVNSSIIGLLFLYKTYELYHMVYNVSNVMVLFNQILTKIMGVYTNHTYIAITNPIIIPNIAPTKTSK